MFFKRIVAVFMAFLSVLFANTPITKKFVDDKNIEHRYIIIQGADNEYTISLIKELYGETSPENEVMYALGVCGPLLLTDSPAVIAQQTENAFALAVKYDIPIWFQIDDVNNQNYAYNGEDAVTADKWYENPANVEKLGFGEDAKPAPYWFNWDIWRKTPAMPCLNSESFISFIKSQLQKGFLPVLEKWINKLNDMDKEYLFAGVSVGWETRIPDYTNIPDDTVDQNGVAITKDEQKMTGYRALENLGYKDEASLKAEAKKQHISVKRLRFNLLSQVVHDYSSMICKEIYDIGIEREKIFTHLVIDTNIIQTDKNMSYNAPYVSAAVNEYSTPGFTNNFNVSLKRLGTLKTKIAKAEPSQQHYGIVEG
ncbi:MAG: hypothetical protein KBT46_03360, partial [Ruminococcus sp.]|nr:hypothetical protein [Candidatus Copronaster equi]